MSKERDLGTFNVSGRKLEQGENRPEDWLGTVSILAPATERSIAGARRYFPQGDPGDFEVTGRTWIDKASGLAYSLVRGQPLASRDPRRSADLFVVADGNLVFLVRDERRDAPDEVAEVGTVGGRRAAAHEPVSVTEEVF